MSIAYTVSSVSLAMHSKLVEASVCCHN